ncbi:MAG: 3-deoxy-manno-octulosonate cytidylyltransferase [Candidatus Marisimplicoccus sp.]
MKTIALIPARLESKRFPNKLIQEINGVPIILKTYNAAIYTDLFDEVYVVSGNDEILKMIQSAGGKTFKSINNHLSGTDRIAEAAIDIDCNIIVNLQGDEPFINKIALVELIKSFDDPKVKMASLMTKFKSFNEINNPNNVKVIVDNHSDALCFSRLPIPYGSKKINDYNRHVGVYAFLKNALIEFSRMERSNLEIIENLEGLRIIENSKKIRMINTNFHGISIDTPEDLLEAEKYLSSDD